MSRKRLSNVVFVVAVISVSSPALANRSAPIGAAFDYAIVDDVKAFTRIVNVPVSREECWEEPVTIYQPPPPAAYSYTPTIVGGIIGAVVGNQFGSGSGKDWATVAGTTLGASVGNDYNRRRAYSPAGSYTTTEQRCRVVNDYRQEERADGYLVTYTYNGRQYETRTPYHPGDRLKVRVDVRPAE